MADDAAYNVRVSLIAVDVLYYSAAVSPTVLWFHMGLA